MLWKNSSDKFSYNPLQIYYYVILIVYINNEDFSVVMTVSHNGDVVHFNENHITFILNSYIYHILVKFYKNKSCLIEFEITNNVM